MADMMTTLRIAAETSDAYSADAFGPVEWVKATEMLLDYGFNKEFTKAILESKYTRRCRDHFGVKEYYVAELYRMVAVAEETKLADEVGYVR